MNKVIAICLLLMTSIAIPATVSVRVGVEWVEYAQLELVGEHVITETSSPLCVSDERGLICQ